MIHLPVPSRVAGRAVLALAALAVIALMTLIPTRTKVAPPADVQFGFNEFPTASSFPLQKQLNAPVQRMFIGWNSVQAAGAGSWDWQLPDSQYHGIISAGLKPLIVVVTAPCWAHPSAPCQGVDTASNPPDPAYDGAWSEFNKRVASRYPKAAAIEVWNEQNIQPAYQPYPDPARYTTLLKAAYNAVKGVGKTSIPVISGGLFSAPATGSYAIADAEFLSAMYEAGAKGFMDGIGVHAYPISTSADGLSNVYDPAAIQAPLERLRAVRNAAGSSSTPFWITEAGASTTTEDRFPPPATEAQQATDLVSIVRTVKAMPDVRTLLIHRLIDRPLELGGPYAAIESGFGVYRTDGTPKQAACALSREFNGSLAC